MFTILVVSPAIAEVGTALRLGSSVQRGDAPLAVRFEPLARTYPAGGISRVEIDPGDGSGLIILHTGRGWIRPRPRYTYRSPGTYTARLTMVTDDGQTMSTRTRITVLPDTPADPSELLVATPANGDAPHEVTFRIGGNSLPFTARAARLSFGDGQAVRVMPHQTVTHTYARPGRYAARLDIRGNHGNRARSLRVITVSEPARLRFTVAPNSGVAPVEVTVRANVPQGDIRHAGVLQNGREIMDRATITGTAEGRKKITLIEPGTYRFEIRAITQNGERYRKVETVTVRPANVADAGPTFYEHEGGVVQIVQQGGSFEGIMRAPTLEQARSGYDVGTTLVRGVFANRAYSALRPLRYDDPDSPRRRFYEDHPVQTAGGTYLIRGENCPDQWEQYSFGINFDENDRATSISGDVLVAEYTTRINRARARLGLRRGSGSLVGNMGGVSLMLSIMRAAGDYSGRPNECVASDEINSVRPATFTRITEEQARATARENIGAIRDFAHIAYDTSDAAVPADGTPRNQDAESGDTAVSSDPVILASGEFIETATDLQGPAPLGLGWRFQRTYRSQSLVHTSLGHGWMHNYQLALTRVGDGWRLRDENGAHEYYSLSGDGISAGDGSRLELNGTLRRITYPSGRTYEFQAVAEDPDRSQLTAIIDPSGARLSMEYDLVGRLSKVIDPAGREALYQYDEERGYLVRVIAPSGRSVGFEHDASGNLTRVLHLSTVTGEVVAETQFGYAPAEEGADRALRHNMTELRLSPSNGGNWGIVRLQYGQDPEEADFDRVVWQQTGALIETFAYQRGSDEDGDTFVTTLQAEGRATEEHVFTTDGRHKSTTYVDTDGARLETLFLYDESWRRIGQQYADGSRIEILARAEPNVSVIRQSPATGSDEATRVWLYESEPRYGQLRAIYGPFSDTAPPTMADAEPELRLRRQFDYEIEGGTNLGRIVHEERIDEEGTRRAVAFLWNENGSLAEIDAEGGARRLFEYNERGELLTVTDHDNDGSTWLLAQYDWGDDGLLIGAQQGDGVYTGFERDADGRIVRSLGADGTDRRFYYDGNDRIIAEDLDGQRRADYTYDAFGRLQTRSLWRATGDAVEERYFYDAFGRLIAMEDPAGLWERDLNALGRTVAERAPDRAERRYEYDAVGMLIREEGDGWSLIHSYDQDRQRIETRFDDGTRTVYRYADGVPVRQLTYASDESLLEDLIIDASDTSRGVGLNLADQPVWTESSKPTRSTPNAYAMSDLVIGADGRASSFKLQDGGEWQVSYSATGQASSLRRNGIEYFGSTFDDSGAASTVHFYGFAPRQIANDKGVVTVTDGRGAVVRNSSDVYGNLSRQTASLGELEQFSNFERDGLGRIISHERDGVGWQRQFEGALATREDLTLPDGSAFRLSRQFDNEGRLTARILPSGEVVAFEYLGDDEVVLSVNGDQILLTYDASGAIARAALGASEVVYDYPVSDIAVDDFSVSLNGTVIQSLQLNEGVVRGALDTETNEIRSFEHDAAGRLVSAFVPRPDSLSAEHITYDEDGSPLKASGDAVLPGNGAKSHTASLDPDGRVVELNGRTYSRDAFGQVRGVTDGEGTTEYLRDAQGRVVSVTGPAGRFDIFYDGGTIAEVRDEGEIVSYISDANGVIVARIVDGTTELLALDYGGAPVAAADGNGQINERTYLTPYGEVMQGSFATLAANMPRPLFDGILFDPNNALYLTPGRVYLADIAQFLAPEPLGPLASVHPYLYAHGDPFTYRDATGSQSSGSMQTDTDSDPAKGLLGAGQEALNKFPEKLDQELNGRLDENYNRSGGRDNAGDRRTDNSGERRAERPRQPGQDTYTAPAPPPETPEQRRLRREREAERFAAFSDLQRRIAEREARERAEAALFKRNVGHARRMLPEQIASRWLQEDKVFERLFTRIYDGDELPWGKHATGPVSGSPGDPHGLLRATLQGDDRVRGRRGDRLRYIFRNELAVAAPVVPPREQARQPDRIPQPGGVSGQLTAPHTSGGSPIPPVAPPTPTPQRPRKPGGMMGGLN